ncbi:unnamed protein product [Cuscuta europaea]|uniref:Uncharacterized protein n=1 Tax=Cuscuta europaea TaxID=41803 RepID=A0A9P0YWH2_CUSEU|nr:unnamed protein product [Cuscuta europaea]
MSSSEPDHFSNFGRKAKKVLTTGYYNYDQRFTVSSRSKDGVAIVSTLAHKGSLSTGDVAATLKCKNSTMHVKADIESNISVSLTINDILPSTKAIASCTLPHYKAGKVEAQYCDEHARLTVAIGMQKKTPVIDVSATVGTSRIAVGTDARYTLASQKITRYNAGICLKNPKFDISLILAEKGDAVKATYLHYLGEKKRGSIAGEMTRKLSTKENKLTVGCSYTVNPHTTVKAKLNNQGKIGTVIQHELKSKSFLEVSGSFDTKSRKHIPKFGVSLSLVP